MGRISLVALWLLVTGATSLASAQRASDDPMLTRATIEQRIASLDSAVARASDNAERGRLEVEVYALRERLRIGDFLPGDRLLISTTRGAFAHDTVVVRPDTTVAVTGLPSVSVRGVLRSELVSHVEQHLARYVREPVFSATPLIRVGVFGGVRTGGYFEVPADSRVSDLLMRAGGPAEAADHQRIVLRRGNQTVLDREAMNDALQTGRSLDQLGIRSGDELTVPLRRQLQWGQVLQWTTALAGLITVIGISR